MLNLKHIISRRFPRFGFSHKVGLLVSGTAAAQLVAVLILPILTRLFTPEHFGILASYVAFIGIVNNISGLRYEMAIPLAKSEEEAFQLLILSVLMVLVFATITAVFVTFIPTFVLPLGCVKWLIPLGVMSVGVYQALSYWSLRKKAYSDLAKTKFSQGIGRALVQIGAGFLSGGAPGLVVGEVMGQSMGILRLCWRDTRQFFEYGSQTTCKALLVSADAYRQFPLLATPASLLNSAGLQAPTLLIAAFYGPVVAGCYFAAQRIVALPVQMVSRAVGDTFFTEAPEIARINPDMFKKMFERISKTLFLGGAVPAVILILAAPYLIPWVLGSSWQFSSTFLQFLTIAYLFALTCSPINFALINRNDYSLYWAAFRLVVTISAVTGSFLASLSPVICVALLSSAMVISYMVELLLWKAEVNTFSDLNKRRCSPY